MRSKKDFYNEEREKQNIIGENIKKLRMEHQMNQETFARKLHLLRQTISAYERGVTLPDILVLMHIADLFGITLDELAGRDISSTHKKKKDNRCKSPEVPQGTIRVCNQSPMSHANPDFGSSQSKKEKP